MRDLIYCACCYVFILIFFNNCLTNQIRDLFKIKFLFRKTLDIWYYVFPFLQKSIVLYYLLFSPGNLFYCWYSCAFFLKSGKCDLKMAGQIIKEGQLNVIQSPILIINLFATTYCWTKLCRRKSQLDCAVMD